MMAPSKPGKQKTTHEDIVNFLKYQEEESSSEDESQAASSDQESGEEAAEQGDQAHEAFLSSFAKKAKPKQKVLERLDTKSAEGGAGGNRVELTDLLADLGDAQRPLLADQLESLEKAQEVAEPMGFSRREQISREVVHEEVKKGLTTWDPVVKSNRIRETKLFPEHGPEEIPTLGVMTKKLTDAGPIGDLGAEMDRILQEYEATVEHVQEAEEQFDEEEALERKQKLAKMRNLMFYEERKAKRIKKIKSKNWRRRARKKRERFAPTLEDLELRNPELAKAERDKTEKKRALERITLRHKNTSKWAKRILHGRNKAPNAAKELNRQLDLGQRLKRKMRSMADSDESSSDPGEEEPEPEEAKNGLLSMGFMKRGAEKAKQARLQMERELRKEERAMGLAPEDGEHESSSDQEAPHGPGKQSFEGASADTPKPPPGQGRHNSFSLTNMEVEEVPRRSAGVLSVPPKKRKKKAKKTKKRKAPEPAASTTLPFFDVGDFGMPARNVVEVPACRQEPPPKRQKPNPKASNEQPPPKPEDQPDESFARELASNPWLQSVNADSGEEGDPPEDKPKGKPKGEAKTLEQELATNPWLQPAKTKLSKKERRELSEVFIDPNKPITLRSDLAEDSAEFKLLPAKDQQKARALSAHEKEQAALIARAFALPNDTDKAFQKEKNEVIEYELPKNESEQMRSNGWGGCWVGLGAPAYKPSKKKVKRQKQVRRAALKKRKDAKLKHVIINSKAGKRTRKKLMLQKTPFPFEGKKELYERSLLHPAGRDWNCHKAFDKINRPKIVTRPGEIIEPMEVWKRDRATEEHREANKKRRKGRHRGAKKKAS